jgi:hypothetical protein
MDRMGRHLFLLITVLLTATLVAGQSGGPSLSGDVLQYLQQGGEDGDVYIKADSLVVANYYKLLAQNSSVTGVPGYRIRIYSGSGLGAKEEQQRIRARFLSLYPDIDAYHRYDEPYFKVYVGDCRTMSEAIQLYDIIEDDFPNLFIVQDQINLKNKEYDNP